MFNFIFSIIDIIMNDMPNVFKFPKSLRNNPISYSCIVDFYNAWKNFKGQCIAIDLKETTYIEANIVALLGAMFDDLTGVNYLNSILISKLNSEVETILKKNNFLSYFGYERIEDTYDTTVEYKKIKASRINEFVEYLNANLFTTTKFPSIPPALKRILISSMAEIFVNAGMHSGCEYVYMCGQVFPRDGRLDFSIVNMGKTIKENVDDFINQGSTIYNVTSTNAINWAVKPRSTTKMNESGGFGLSKTIDFITKNKGDLLIISDDGCWELNSEGEVSMQLLTNKFNGTIVNFEINMNDSYNYDII